jgi:hypothetical protein
MGLISSVHAEEKASPSPSKIQGKVSDIIDVAAYTYVEVDTGTEKVWAATPKATVKKGDTVAFSTEMPMTEFYSDSIKRTFPLIYFINGFVANSNEEQPIPHKASKPIKKMVKGIDKVKGGQDIAELYAKKDDLKGKTVKIRGKVTRFAAEVMDKNWLHIQDSSGSDDLTITTDKATVVAIGDVVVVEGKLALDKDFGYGYLYAVMLEDAKVTKESQ